MTGRTIDQYLLTLESALGALPEAERADILAETRAHLADRASQLGEEIAIDRMGPARALASGHLASLGYAPVDAPLGARIWVWPSAVILWACSVFATGLLVLEIVSPRVTGLWMNVQTGNLFLGAASIETPGQLIDLAGPLLAPAAAVISALAALCGWRVFRLRGRLAA